MRCTIISDLNTIVHVVSRNLFCNVRNISATPASPACVATRICSTYFDLGAASYLRMVSWGSKFPLHKERGIALIFVPPLTDFSNEDIVILQLWDFCFVNQDLGNRFDCWLQSRLIDITSCIIVQSFSCSSYSSHHIAAQFLVEAVCLPAIDCAESTAIWQSSWTSCPTDGVVVSSAPVKLCFIHDLRTGRT